MKSGTGLLAGLFLFSVFILAGTAAAEKRCEKVNVHLYDYAIFSEQEDCGAFRAPCRTADMVGTINGTWTAYSIGYDFEFPTFGDSSVWRGESIFEGKHGEIQTMMVGVNFWPAYDAVGDFFNLETHVVTGGTGRYEGATGYVLLRIAFFGGTGEATGQICWPEE